MWGGCVSGINIQLNHFDLSIGLAHQGTSLGKCGPTIWKTSDCGTEFRVCLKSPAGGIVANAKEEKARQHYSDRLFGRERKEGWFSLGRDLVGPRVATAKSETVSFVAMNDVHESKASERTSERAKAMQLNKETNKPRR